MTSLLVIFGSAWLLALGASGIEDMEWDDWAQYWGRLKLALAIYLGGFLVCGVMISAAHARDPDGRYAGSPNKAWFDGLRSGRGPCCSDADGTAIANADWDSLNGHYRVRIPSSPGGAPEWVDVPAEAVLGEPNKDGRTIVWPVYGYSGVSIRCFIAGAGI